MNSEEKLRLFDIKCRSKRGLPVTEEEHRFTRKMYELYPDEYGEDERKVFIATAPFGAQLPPEEGDPV